MAVIKFTAVNRGELPTWLAAGATYYLANKLQAYPRRLIAKREEAETLDGTPESYLHALQREYQIATDFVYAHEVPAWRAFLTSVLNRETFSIDLTAQQLLGNPGFESGATSPWAVQPGGTGFTVNANSGLQALGRYAGQVGLVVNASSAVVDQGVTGASPSFPVGVGVTGLVQALFKRNESSLPNRDVAAQINWRDSGGSGLVDTTTAFAAQGTVGYQLVSATGVSPASTAQMNIRVAKNAPHNTNEAGGWYFDEMLLATLSSWITVALVDDDVTEEQVGGVGVRYSFRVKTVP